MFDLSACHVERNAEGDYILRWHSFTPGQRVAIYMSEDAEHYYHCQDPGTPVQYSTSEQAVVANPDKDRRHYFYIESERGEGAIVAERQLSLEGTSNFRDLGGYEADQGRRLRWGKLYRSSKLSGLSSADQQYFHRLGVTLVCDFRQAMEQELEPSLLGSEGRHTVASLPVAPGSRSNFIDNLHNGIIQVDNAATFMEEINRDFIANQMPRYAEMFQLLLAGDQQMLIHCASGKDRTGVGAALILDVLGVDEDAIVQDYMLTNDYLPIEQEIERLADTFTDETGAAVSAEVLRPMIEVRPEYIQACFDEIRKRFDSREHFFAAALDLDEQKIERLRQRYLH